MLKAHNSKLVAHSSLMLSKWYDFLDGDVLIAGAVVLAC